MRKNKLKIVLLFLLISMLAIAENEIQNKKTYRNKTGEVIELEVDNISENFEIENSDESLIYLDELERDKDNKPKTKLEKLINKIDDKVNPVLQFYVPDSYGEWYLIMTSSSNEKNYENVKYDFKQEETGYRIIKDYFNSNNGIWVIEDERGWINEKKGKVYLGTEKKWFKSYKNEILFFDENYKYMIIHFEKDGVTRVFSRFSNGRMDLKEEEREKFESLIEKQNFYNISHDAQVRKNYEDNSKVVQTQKERIKELEKQILTNPEEFFKLTK